ncbi:DUF4395 family protein [Patescibacteria group bacterium]|nr:DUF4395 family protein [Patescibacteria group bacterium]
MKQCSIYDKSWRFFKIICGILALVAFLIQNYWLVLAVSLLMAFGIFSIKFNIPYQFHVLVLRKLFKNGSGPIQKELGEISFVSATGGFFFLFGFLLLCFGKFINFAWIWILIVVLLILLGGFTDACLAASMYVFFKKIFKRQ